MAPVEVEVTTCLFSGGLFKYLVGVVLSISGEGSLLTGFLGVESGLRLRVVPPSRLFEYMDARAWIEAFTQTLFTRVAHWESIL